MTPATLDSFRPSPWLSASPELEGSNLEDHYPPQEGYLRNGCGINIVGRGVQSTGGGTSGFPTAEDYQSRGFAEGRSGFAEGQQDIIEYVFQRRGLDEKGTNEFGAPPASAAHPRMNDDRPYGEWGEREINITPRFEEEYEEEYDRQHPCSSFQREALERGARMLSKERITRRFDGRKFLEGVLISAVHDELSDPTFGIALWEVCRGQIQQALSCVVTRRTQEDDHDPPLSTRNHVLDALTRLQLDFVTDVHRALFVNRCFRLAVAWQQNLTDVKDPGIRQQIQIRGDIYTNKSILANVMCYLTQLQVVEDRQKVATALLPAFAGGAEASAPGLVRVEEGGAYAFFDLVINDLEKFDAPMVEVFW